MKTTFKWMFAAILLCGLTISSCKKDPQPTPDPEPEPTTQTVLAGITAVGVPFFDSVTYSYEYDDQYRLVRSKAVQTPSGFVIHDYHFTYSDGHITVEGPSSANDEFLTYECTLDSEGRITHIDETSAIGDSTTSIQHSDYTYDAEGRIESSFEITEDASRDGVTQNYTWEGEEIRSISAGDGIMVTDFETSDAPAQAMFNEIGYDASLWMLCTQGCFGTLPSHMPSKRTNTVEFPIPGMPPYVTVDTYTYTLNAEGRLATMEAVMETPDEAPTYTFIWEER